MGLVMAGFAPHPPLLIPEVGGAQIKNVKATRDSLQELGFRVRESGAETLVIISPHGPVMHDAVTVLVKEQLSGDFSKFGAEQVSLTLETDLELYHFLQEEADARELRLQPFREGSLPAFSSGGVLDHGVTVPLYYLQEQGVYSPGLVMSFSMEPYPRLFSMGEALQRAIERSNKKVAVIASGDLSHRLSPEAPAGYDQRGEEFDRTLVELLQDYRVDEILEMEHALIERAGECGFRSLVILLGCLKGFSVHPEILSYEGPFGVGYLVTSFSLGEPDKTVEPFGKSSREEDSRHKDTPEDPLAEDLVKLARDSLEYYLKHHERMPVSASLPPGLKKKKGGVFVSLKKDNHLRGCIGTIKPNRENLAEEIVDNAVKAGFEDPRFPPLEADELPELSISVDVLSPLEKIEDTSRLDPQKYGVLIKSGRRSGLLLPDLEGVENVEHQLDIAMSKGGISYRDNYEIYRFTVSRYTEK